MPVDCWHQRRHATLAAARQRVACLDATLFARLRLCHERLAASDEAMRRGDYAGTVKILEEELEDV